jgi:hypothetical protein
MKSKVSLSYSTQISNPGRRFSVSPLFLLLTFFSLFISSIIYSREPLKPVLIVQQANASPRIKFGITRLTNALKANGYSVTILTKDFIPSSGQIIVVAEENNDLYHRAMRKWYFDINGHLGREEFSIASARQNAVLIAGGDASGVLYGCLELADRIKKEKRIPPAPAISDHPEMILRGACIGVQKPYYLPGRTVYEYPYTPETFPWFYNKKLWIEYLDSMVNNRMNSLYLWNGHPFASLVRVKEYPYAVEVDEATFKKNEEIYRFLTEEADKRGIWVIQMFYNIIVSKPFAEKNHIKTQDRDRPIIPLIADYTRKSIAAFVAKYPNVGLMVCLGEAMEGIGNDDITWFTQTIIPGVKDGLKILGKTEEPPIVLRAHDTDAPAVMRAALPLYKNLYTEAKFNGEALTTYAPRGKWAELHQILSKLGSVQIENVHIMANLEPFRYGSIDFIQKSVQGMENIMGGRGLHLYPQASYWDWPYTADSVKGKRLLQTERDWVWYAAWSRYAWNSHRDRNEEINYWSQLLGSKYGCSAQQGRNILEAYEESGEIAPKILRRFGITDGNRQTMTLGMLMTQLINPYRYGLFTLLYESESPVGEMLIDYAEKEWNGQPHIGETPVQIIREVQEHGKKAVAAIEEAASSVTQNKEEFNRLKNDMYCYQAMAEHYAAKAEAAIYVLRFKYSNDVKDLEAALPYLQSSVDSYKKLVNLTKGTYLYANSMQTAQRKIPLRGVDGTFKTWQEVLVPFESELTHFKHKIDSLKRQPPAKIAEAILFGNVDPQLSGNPSRYKVDSTGQPFTDTSLTIRYLAKELKSLKGIQQTFQKQRKEATAISFTTQDSVKLLIGFFNSKDTLYAQPPELETNAYANTRGQAEIKIANAIVIPGMPTVNVHSYDFPPGQWSLKIPKGLVMVLGFIRNDQPFPVYDAGLTEKGAKKEIDWLFE